MRLNHVLCLLLLSAAGCTSVPYRAGKDSGRIHGYRLPAGEPQLVVGRPNRFLDASDWMWPGSLLGKLMLWNVNVDSHQVSPETIDAIRRYLVDNELRDVKVRINGYRVGDELRRTIRNKAVGAGWRFTFGMMAWLQYTILPGRFFGGDHYNPYANSINIYSDLVPVALHESGHAKDFAGRTFKGTYAFLYAAVPFFNLYPEAKASSDVLSYLQDLDDRAGKKSAYHLLYPAYGTYLGGDIASWVNHPWNFTVQAGAIVAGHVVGRTKAAFMPRPSSPPPAPRPAQGIARFQIRGRR